MCTLLPVCFLLSQAASLFGGRRATASTTLALQEPALVNDNSNINVSGNDRGNNNGTAATARATSTRSNDNSKQRQRQDCRYFLLCLLSWFPLLPLLLA
jgi:hypothetical protein